MPTLRLACLLFTTLCLPAHATTALVMAMPGFAWEGKGWVYELLSGMQANGQPLTLHLLPPARAVARFYRDGDGDLFAAALLCRRNDTHYLTLGVRDFEVFMTRTGNQVPGPSNPPAKNETILVVRGFNHPFVRQHPELGYQILSRIPHLDEAAEIALRHHERVLIISHLVMAQLGGRALQESVLTEIRALADDAHAERIEIESAHRGPALRPDLIRQFGFSGCETTGYRAIA